MVTQPRSDSWDRRKLEAIKVIDRILADEIFLEEAIDPSLALLSEERDRHWLRDVVAGVLRWRGRLESAVDFYAHTKKPSGKLRKILILAIYQIIGQERTVVPKVVAETVDLVKSQVSPQAASFANALLRKIVAERARWQSLSWMDRPESVSHSDWASLPTWMWNDVRDKYGLEVAEAFAMASLDRPQFFSRTGPDGQSIVQNISAQMLIDHMAEELHARIGAKPKLLDLCAAPGGKAIAMAWSGFEVTATDLNSERLALVSENQARVNAPGLQIITWEEVGHLSDWDAVWIDAPCSGSGTLRKHPEIRWIRDQDAVRSLMEIQMQLIRDAWEKLRNGGFLIYSVCSVLFDEGAGILQQAGLDSKAVSRWQFWPQDPSRGDGYFAALLQKR